MFLKPCYARKKNKLKTKIDPQAPHVKSLSITLGLNGNPNPMPENKHPRLNKMGIQKHQEKHYCQYVGTPLWPYSNKGLSNIPGHSVIPVPLDMKGVFCFCMFFGGFKYWNPQVWYDPVRCLGSLEFSLAQGSHLWAPRRWAPTEPVVS